MSTELLDSIQVQPGVKIAVVKINSKDVICTVALDDNSLSSTKTGHGLSGNTGSATVTFNVFTDAQDKAIAAGKVPAALTRADVEAFRTSFNADKGASFTATFYKADPNNNGQLTEAGSISAPESASFLGASIYNDVVYGIAVNMYGAEVKNGTEVSYLRPMVY